MDKGWYHHPIYYWYILLRFIRNSSYQRCWGSHVLYSEHMSPSWIQMLSPILGITKDIMSMHCHHYAFPSMLLIITTTLSSLCYNFWSFFKLYWGIIVNLLPYIHTCYKYFHCFKFYIGLFFLSNSMVLWSTNIIWYLQIVFFLVVLF